MLPSTALVSIPLCAYTPERNPAFCFRKSSTPPAIPICSKVGAKILGVTGRDGGYTGIVSDACIVIPTQSPDTITPHAEAWQAVVWHMLVTDPRIMIMSNKWESLSSTN